jgi:hypothetical protein
MKRLARSAASGWIALLLCAGVVKAQENCANPSVGAPSSTGVFHFNMANLSNDYEELCAQSWTGPDGVLRLDAGGVSRFWIRWSTTNGWVGNITLFLTGACPPNDPCTGHEVPASGSPVTLIGATDGPVFLIIKSPAGDKQPILRFEYGLSGSTPTEITTWGRIKSLMADPAL